jgi:hypothetical protein
MPFMMKVVFAAALSIALSSLTVPQVHAQSASIPRNDKILIDYQDPINPEMYGLDPNDKNKEVQEEFADYEALKRVHDRIRERKLLERYAQFLAPLRLPTTLRLITKQCDEMNAFFSPRENSITMCLEYMRGFEASAPGGTTEEGISRDDAIIGSVVATLLHETGHAIFHILRIPVLGREEDAADQVAAFVMLQFGDQVALTTVKGSLWKWRNWGVPLGRKTTSLVQQSIYADSHSTAQQRFITFLCIAYGGKPKVFQPLIDAGFMPKGRAAACANDYKQAERAFEKTVLPHIDRDLMAKVQSATWFYPQDMGLIPVQTR